MAMDEISTKDLFKAMWKEFRVALIVAVVLAIVNAIRIIIQYQNIQIALVVSATLIGTVVLSKQLGVILPIIAKKLKFDPAIMAAPLITTVVDALSVMLYFSICTAVFNI
jgi:magnesium transporter